MPDGHYPTPRFLDLILDGIGAVSTSFVLHSQGGVPGGWATLGLDGLVPSAQLPAAATGGMNYRGQWNPVTNVPVLATGGLFGGAATAKGDYVVVTATGTSPAIDGITSWTVGDWAVSTGSAWQKQANSTGFGTMAPQNANAVTITGGSTTGQAQLGVTTGDLFYGIASGPFNFAWLDRWGFPSAWWNRDNTWTFSGGITATPVSSPILTATDHVASRSVAFSSNLSLSVATIPGFSLVLADPAGFVYYAIDNNGAVTTATQTPTSFSASEIASRTNADLANSMIVKGRVNTTAARPTWKYNHIIWYGQSEAVGFAGTPALTITQPYDNLSLGTSPRPSVRLGTDFIPVTDTNLHPLIGANQDDTGAIITIKIGTIKGVHGCTVSAGGVISTTDAIDFTTKFAAGDQFAMGNWVGAANNNGTQYSILSLTATTITVNESYFVVVSTPQDNIDFFTLNNNSYGEDLTVPGMNFWRRQQLAFRGLRADPSRLLVATDCGYSATSIAGLSKGATPEDFNRLRRACTQVKAAAVAAGGDYGIPVITFFQGGTDGVIGTTAADYKARFIQLYTDMVADLCTTIAVQTDQPFFFFYQLSGGTASLAGNIIIPQAQLDLALSPPSPNHYCIGPYYQITDWGPHPDDNGYRWFGSKVGQILHRVVERGEGWMPLYCTGATYRGRQILLSFHVPEPPLQVQPFWSGHVASTSSSLGFDVSDSSGAVTVSASVVSATEVLLFAARDFTSAPVVGYGNTLGSGNICDSDPTVSELVYVYTEGSGQSPLANIPALIGKPYPLWNWLCLFTLTAVAG